MGSSKSPWTADEADLIVIGAGPAGVRAAIAAAAQNLRVVLLDEADEAPGDVHGATAAGVAVRAGEAVWSVAGAFRVDTIGPDGPRHYRAPAVIVASGAQDLVVPFPGWTMPGVIGLAAADRLNAQGVLPGRRVLVAGCGPLLASVGAGILDLGGDVVAVVDLGSGGEQCPRLAAAGVPILHSATLVSVSPDGTGLRAEVARVDATGRRLAAEPPCGFTVDAVAVGHGLLPRTEITRLMRAAHAYDPALGCWHPVLDAAGRTSVPGLHVAAEAARIAGATAGLATLRQGLVEQIAPDTIVCRCEDVTRAAIDSTVGAGARDLNQLKAWTRCGMGPCQGRMCADTAAALLLAHGIARQAAGQFTGRTPLRPVPLDRLTGDYAYADIVLPPPAPL